MSVTFSRFTASADRFKIRSPVPMSYYAELTRHCAVLKTIWYSARFRGIVVVGRGSRIRVHRSARVSLAPGSVLVIGLAHDAPAGTVLRLRPRSSLRVDGRVQIARACQVAVDYDAMLVIGDGTFLNEGASVVCYSVTTIGPGCLISWGVRILDTDIHRLDGSGRTSPHAPVHVGENCWIGVNAVLLKGTRLGEGSVVAAGAVVASDVPPGSLVAGVPARVVRENVTWAR